MNDFDGGQQVLSVEFGCARLAVGVDGKEDHYSAYHSYALRDWQTPYVMRQQGPLEFPTQYLPLPY